MGAAWASVALTPGGTRSDTRARTDAWMARADPATEGMSMPTVVASKRAHSWAFALRDEPGGGTRLIVRERYEYLRPWARLLVEPTEVVSFMSQKMLRGIRERAERTTSSAGRARCG